MLYALIFCAEFYVYLNQDRYYEKSEHIIRFEKEQDAWKTTLSSKEQATFTATLSSGPASSKDDTVVEDSSC